MWDSLIEFTNMKYVLSIDKLFVTDVTINWISDKSTYQFEKICQETKFGIVFFIF